VSSDLPPGGSGEVAPTEGSGEREESQAAVQEQAEAPSSPAASKGKTSTWGRNLLSLKRLRRKSRDESGTGTYP